MLFNEPKLLKYSSVLSGNVANTSFSALQRAEIAEIPFQPDGWDRDSSVSVLFNEPKLLKFYRLVIK